MGWFKNIGPGVLVAAAFIGPGTVATCTMAGVGFGYALLWALLLSVIATIVLQEMAARLGIVTQKGLAEVIKGSIPSKGLRVLALAIILGAIVIGNAAYEGGNIGGATLGMQALFGTAYQGLYPWLIGAIAFVFLFLGNYKVLERTLVTLVLLMSLSFIITAIMTGPELLPLLKGMFVPSLPDAKAIFTVVALVGTTVVPYNLFLHASLVKEKWKSPTDLKWARKDTVVSVLLGGLVSMAIVVAAAKVQSDGVNGILDLAKALEPLYGKSAVYLMGIGLFAAGITSAITAPLAAAYVANSCFGWQAHLKDIRFRAVWFLVLILGISSLTLGIKPLEIITFAQITNGVLLPFVAVFLLWAANKESVMGKAKNRAWHNILGLLIIVIVLLLGIKGIAKALGWM
ncbi:Nramp family divalent metal transporter [Sediminicola luteus]|uniref:Manganese transporter n=1 Tax=Sediminicola luteus TaxID=319238 RepID=A0A2A4G6H7_9FLAO|nr:Nramp family divalent metal transporter [Sediminicola luteus]PCE64033.1 manganese transporter [Sediminicola luteus]